MTRATKAKARAKPARKPPAPAKAPRATVVAPVPAAAIQRAPSRSGPAVQFGPTPSAPGSRLKGAK